MQRVFPTDGLAKPLSSIVGPHSDTVHRDHHGDSHACDGTFPRDSASCLNEEPHAAPAACAVAKLVHYTSRETGLIVHTPHNVALAKMLGLTAVSGTTVFEYLCGDITTSKELVATTTYIMKCQTFVKTGATLTIPAGTLIYAMPVGPTATAAPALIIEKGTSRARRFHRSHDAPAHLLSHRCLLTRPHTTRARSKPNQAP